MGIWIGAVLQVCLPTRISIMGAQPDFILLFVSAISLLVTPRLGMFTGFVGGLLQSATLGVNMWQFILTRMLDGYVSSRIGESDLEIGVVLGAIIIAVSTLATRLFYVFVAPPPSIGAYIGATIGCALYNFVVALPIFALFRLILRSKSAGS